MRAPRPGRGIDGFRNDERLPVSGVEALGQVPGQLQMLALIVAYRHPVGVVEQDVGRHENRVGEQTGAGRFLSALGRLVLELGHAPQFAEARRAFQHPRQLGVSRDVALDEEGAGVGVEPCRQEQRRHGERPGPELRGVTGDGQGMQIDHAVEAVARPLVGDPPAHGAQQIAEVRVAGGLDARENSRHEVMVCPAGRGPTGIVVACPTR